MNWHWQGILGYTENGVYGLINVQKITNEGHEDIKLHAYCSQPKLKEVAIVCCQQKLVETEHPILNIDGVVA